MRPAYLFAETAARFQSRIEVVKDDVRIDGKSVLSILTLGAAEGTSLELVASGADAEDAVEALTRLVRSGFPMVSGNRGSAAGNGSGNPLER